MISLAATAAPSVLYRSLGELAYEPTFAAMQQFTQNRQAGQADEIWGLQHPPVYTLGRAAKSHNLLNVGQIPVVQVDRGGDVTYHGPGQVVIYLLAYVSRLGLSVRQLVSAIEQSLVALLAKYAIVAAPRADAPGVYVGDAKIASLGLRIRRGYSYHGLALNVAMDMSPWQGINACALGVPVTQMADLLAQKPDCDEVEASLVEILAKKLGYADVENRKAD